MMVACVDSGATIVLKYADDFVATLVYSAHSPAPNEAVITGSKGYIKVPILFLPHCRFPIFITKPKCVKFEIEKHYLLYIPFIHSHSVSETFERVPVYKA